MIMLALYQDGRAEIVSPSRIFQGTDTERIVVLSPYPATVPLQIAITKPNGTSTGYFPMQSIEIPSEYVGLSAWSYSPRDTLTGQYGTAYINLLARLPATETSGRNLTTFMCELTIEESTLPSLPPQPTPDVYEQILDYLATYGEMLNNIENRLDTLEKAEVTGVKGAAETEYRQGNVNITPANIGLGNVDDTSDMDKPVSTAQAQAIATAKQEAITAAQQNAEAYADSVASTAKEEAITASNQYTDTKAQAAIQEAVAEANAYTDSQIGEKVGTTVNVGGVAQNKVDFTSDPQTQLNQLKNSVVGTKVITFNASQFTNGTITFTPSQTGMINNQFIVNVERLTANGYQLTANTAVKGTNGSLTLTYNTPFDGRVVIQGNGALPLKEGAQLLNAPGMSETDGYTQAAVNGIVSNPNLLINPDFKINQRGQTTYIGSRYTVDRWRTRNAATQIDVLDNGIKFIIGVGVINSYETFTQSIENWQKLLGKTVTLTVHCSEYGVTTNPRFRLCVALSNTSGTHSSFVSTTSGDGGISISSEGTFSSTYILPNSTDYKFLNVGIWKIDLDANVGDYIVVDWIKLEIGSVATAFTPPNIAEELPKCQRYYIDTCYNIRSQLAPYAVGSGIAYTTALAYFVVSVPTSMKLSSSQVTPIYDTTKLTLLADGKILPITVLDVVGNNNSCISVRVGGTFEVGQALILRVKANENNLGILAFDAEV